MILQSCRSIFLYNHIKEKPAGTLCREKEEILFSARMVRSEAVQVNQLGYRPDDPSKKAYLSQWMGLGGGIAYDHIRQFHLVDEAGDIVYTGPLRIQNQGQIVAGGQGEISSLCPVYVLDFSGFRQEGTYRVLVPGIGCSFPFVIGTAESWEEAFRASMNAHYCHRRGRLRAGRESRQYVVYDRDRCPHAAEHPPP